MTQIDEFARFARQTSLEDIPEAVRDYAKIVLLDTLVCGLAAGELERSRMVQRVARRFGGADDCTVFGVREGVASVNAAYANAEIMNALDADDTFYNAAHFGAIVLAAALAEGERLGSSGAELLRAFILGFEVSARMNLGSMLMEFDDDQFHWSQLVGNGGDAFGAATAAGLLGDFGHETLSHALGLVGWTAPTPKAANMGTRTEFNSFKYCPYGCVAQVGVMAAALAEEGYVGERDVLDITPGFFEAQGSVGVYRHLLNCSDEHWWINETALKPYPSCRYTHAAIDAVQAFQAQHGVALEEIESIELRLNPVAYATHFFREPATEIPDDHRAPLHGAFNIPYVTALALLGHRRGPGWYASERLGDAQVWDLARRISTAPDPELAAVWKDEVLRSEIHRPRVNRAVIRVRVAGQTHDQAYDQTHDQAYEMVSDFNQGDPWQTETRADWDWVTRKFDDFCEGMVPAQQRAALVALVRDLEAVGDIKTELSPLLRSPA